MNFDLAKILKRFVILLYFICLVCVLQKLNLVKK
jgi:hypothetical protein